MPADFIEAASQTDAREIINRGIAYAIIIAGFLSVAYIFFGGITFILSGGQDDKIKQAVSTIRYAIIGLVITIFAIVIVQFVGKALGINVVQYLSFSHIVNLVRDLTSGGGGDAINTLD
ncbi:hypothetical protein KKG71_03130 [Patescibacteria group bacterium]|nr:hypothetical protein [Patescibacteria group bacterium]